MPACVRSTARSTVSSNQKAVRPENNSVFRPHRLQSYRTKFFLDESSAANDLMLNGFAGSALLYRIMVPIKPATTRGML